MEFGFPFLTGVRSFRTYKFDKNTDLDWKWMIVSSLDHYGHLCLEYLPQTLLINDEVEGEFEINVLVC